MTKMDQIIDYDKKIAARERAHENNKKLIAIVAAIVLALIGLIVYIMKDSNEVTTTQNPSGQLVNFQGADLQEEKDGKLVWALSAEKIEYDPRTKAIVLTNLKGLFYQDDVTTTITAPHAVLTGDRNSLDIDQGCYSYQYGRCRI